MQWYVYLVAILSVAFVSHVAVELVGRPLRMIFRLRRKALARILSYRNISLPRPRELAISSRQIREFDEAARNVRAAQHSFNDLGAQFLALGESEPAVCVLIALFGLDIVQAGHELIHLSEAYAAATSDNAELREAIKRAIQAANTALANSHRPSGDDLIKIRPEPMNLPEAIYLRQRNRPLRHPRVVSSHAKPRTQPWSRAATHANADRFRPSDARPDLASSKSLRNRSEAIFLTRRSERASFENR